MLHEKFYIVLKVAPSKIAADNTVFFYLLKKIRHVFHVSVARQTKSASSTYSVNKSQFRAAIQKVGSPALGRGFT